MQKAIVDAYYTVMASLATDLQSCAQSGNPGGLLKEIANASFPQRTGNMKSDMKSDLHPLTKHVLIEALTTLKDFNGEYSKVQVSTFGLSSTLRNAQQYVKKGYVSLLTSCQAGEALPDGKTLIGKLN